MCLKSFLSSGLLFDAVIFEFVVDLNDEGKIFLMTRVTKKASSSVVM